MKKSLGLTIKVVIFLIGTTGLLTIGSVAPNLLQVVPFVRKFLNQKTPKNQVNFKLKKVADELIKEGYIKKSGAKLELTNKGEILLMKISPTLIKRPKWDGKWRIVCFDVGEGQRTKRDIFRDELKSLGFIQMQRSVWVSPYPCEKYIEILRVEHNFGKNMQYILAEKISGDERIRKHFKL
jgi:hypothetical protein